MHTYRRITALPDSDWEVGYYHPDGTFTALGPVFVDQCWAAAYASFLNGGRYNPYEIEALFRMEPAIEDDEITYPRPKGMDYEPSPRQVGNRRACLDREARRLLSRGG